MLGSGLQAVGTVGPIGPWEAGAVPWRAAAWGEPWEQETPVTKRNNK